MFTQYDIQIGDLIFTLQKQEYIVKRVYKRFVEVHRKDRKLTPTIRIYYGSIAEVGGFVSWERKMRDSVEQLIWL